jgi:excisionase family DNA binding protein
MEENEKHTKPPAVHTVTEARKILRISHGSAYAGIKSRSIPHIRIGKRILVPAGALQKLLDRAGK